MRCTLAVLLSRVSVPIFSRRCFCGQNPMNGNSTEPAFADNNAVTYECIDKVALIGINRPEKRNAVDLRTGRALRNKFNTFIEDSGLHVAVLYGHGGNFCSGFDLGELASSADDSETDPVARLSKIDGPMGPTRMVCPKPVIGALSGWAVAGGLELALWCDIRVADADAVLGVFNRRFGVPLIDGGSVRLPRMVGIGRAMDLILTGRALSATEARDWGLVTEVTEPGTALGKAVTMAHAMASFPQLCLHHDRRSAYYSAYTSKGLGEALKFEFSTSKKVIARESIDGAKRFIEGKMGRHGKFE